jgi:hypothetical protein
VPDIVLRAEKGRLTIMTLLSRVGLFAATVAATAAVGILLSQVA